MADAKTSPYGQWLRVIWVAHIIPVKLSLMYYFGLGVACPPSPPIEDTCSTSSLLPTNQP